MDAMSQTREQLLHEAIRQADGYRRIARAVERDLTRWCIAFWTAAIVGGSGWLWVWALLGWGWAR